MDKWIRDLINSVTAGLTALINAVVDRIAWVYNVFIGLGIKVRSAFDGALNGLRTKLTALASLAREVYTTLHWLVFIRIPAVVSHAVTSATNWLVTQLISVRDFLRTLIDNLTAWILQQVRRIDDFFTQVINWAATKFNDLIAKVTWLLSTVVNLLTDPRRLAAWVIDAIVAEFLRWVDRNADRLVIILRERSVAYTIQAAQRIESMIARLL